MVSRLPLLAAESLAASPAAHAEVDWNPDQPSRGETKVRVVKVGELYSEDGAAHVVPPIYIPPAVYLRGEAKQIDARLILGLPKSDAARMLEEHGCFMRVLEIDGQTFDREQDGVSHRMDVAVQDGIVTALLLEP